MNDPLLLQTDRLSLRPITLDDLQSIHELLSLPEVDHYNALGLPKDIQQTQGWLTEWIEAMQRDSAKHYTLRIELSDIAKTFVGLYGLKVAIPKYCRAEIWYKLLPGQWGKGFATEATQRILDYCFVDLKLHRVEAGAAVENKASHRVLEKCGMTQEGTKRQDLPLKSGFSDTHLFAILASEFSE